VLSNFLWSHLTGITKVDSFSEFSLLPLEICSGQFLSRISNFLSWWLLRVNHSVELSQPIHHGLKTNELLLDVIQNFRMHRINLLGDLSIQIRHLSFNRNLRVNNFLDGWIWRVVEIIAGFDNKHVLLVCKLFLEIQEPEMIVH